MVTEHPTVRHCVPARSEPAAGIASRTSGGSQQHEAPATGDRAADLQVRPPGVPAPEAPKETGAAGGGVSWTPEACASDVEAELDYVAVLHDVVLAFHADLADGA